MKAPEDPKVRGLAAWPLWLALVVTISAGAATIVAAFVVIGFFIPLSDDGITGAQRLTAAFASATAAGALALLVVNIRKQELAEQSARRQLIAAFGERFAAAAAQLGSSAPAERLAGVYALASLADEYSTGQQQCVDVLCGYLRLPFDLATDGLAARSTEISKPGAQNNEATKITSTLAARPFDHEVRQTIVRIIARHLAPGNNGFGDVARPGGWSHLDFDFTGANLTNAPFNRAYFSGQAGFGRVQFNGYTSFQGAVFAGRADFIRATFNNEAGFSGALFAKTPLFSEAVFWKYADFSEAIFSRTAFFGRSKFMDFALFQEADFAEDAHFPRAEFAGGTSFVRTTVGRNLRLHGSKFSSAASFVGASVTGSSDFAESVFEDKVKFDTYIFDGGGSFRRVNFGAGATFLHARFSGSTFFTGTSSGGDLVFDGSVRAEGGRVSGLSLIQSTGDTAVLAGGQPFYGWPTSGQQAIAPSSGEGAD